MMRRFRISVFIIIAAISIAEGCSTDDPYWDSATRTSSLAQMKRIGRALQDYRARHNSFPPGVSSMPQNGISWRVHLLPYLGKEEAALYSRFKLDEPWDSEVNAQLANQMPSIFRFSVRGGGNVEETCLVAIPSDHRGTDGVREGDTVIVVELDSDQSVPWTKPEELDREILRMIQGKHKGQFVALLSNGMVEMRDGTAATQ